MFVTRGEELFATTADGGFNCAGCHGEGAVGGSAPYTLTDENDEFVATVNWKAPSLQTVLLRFSEEELRDIIVYGRPFSPMSAWGTEGGGPLNEQQVDNLMAYIGSIQLDLGRVQGQRRGSAACSPRPGRRRRDRLRRPRSR